MPSKYSQDEIDAFTDKEFADAMAQSWASRDGDTFLSLFTPDALVDHPLFKGEVPVETILVAACRANASVTQPVDAGSNAAGDTLYFSFDDFGVRHGIAPSRVGTVKATLKKERRRVAHMTVYPFGIRPSTEEQKELSLGLIKDLGITKGKDSLFSAKDLDDMSPKGLAERLGKAWGNNDVASFVSFFTDDAVIEHPMFERPVSPAEAAEVLNGSYIGETELRQAFINSSGQLVALYDENATDLPDPSPTIPTMRVTADLVDNRISRLVVHGYSVRHADQAFIEEQPE